MNSYFDIYRKKTCGRAFFIGANTPRGFEFSAADKFREDGLFRLYILKGGPGTGKSTLMKRVAENFSKDCVKYYCSSDPDSLDAVLIETKRGTVTVADGTAPHTADPQYPGACGVTVDLGEGFDIPKLSCEKEKIAALTAAKGEHFQRAYKYLNAADEMIRARQKIGGEAYLSEKAERWANRFAQRKNAVGKGKCEKVRTLSLSCRGGVRISGFDGAKKKILLSDCGCILPEFMKTLSRALVCAGEDIAVSEAPLGGIAEIYIPGRDTLISPFAAGNTVMKVNLRRFFDSAALSDVRGKLNFIGKCLNMAVCAALEELESAGRAHGELERIYTPAMDFSFADKACERIIGEIAELTRG